MTELADVFRRFGEGYMDAYGDAMPPSHKRAIDNIINCRTVALGGNLFGCDACHSTIYAYHSCKNRHCPKCHTSQTRIWLEKRREEMLPIPYFHLTATIPESLRKIFRANQNDCYAILMKATAEALTELARDPRHVGGTVGILMVLHTWTQQLIFHPHVHCLVTAGGVSDSGAIWHPAKKGFLVPSKALARLIRGKTMTALKTARPDIVWPQSAWRQEWVVHCVVWGNGERAVLDYLARYAFRIAITNRRILAMDGQTVSFRHKDRKQRRWRTSRLSGQEFMRRFLQHVLPRGFHKIRYFGLWHHAKRAAAKQLRLLIGLERPPAANNLESEKDAGKSNPVPATMPVHADAICPSCKRGRLILLQHIPRPAARSP